LSAHSKELRAVENVHEAPEKIVHHVSDVCLVQVVGVVVSLYEHVLGWWDVDSAHIEATWLLLASLPHLLGYRVRLRNSNVHDLENIAVSRADCCAVCPDTVWQSLLLIRGSVQVRTRSRVFTLAPSQVKRASRLLLSR
jgi:hypothetical protein